MSVGDVLKELYELACVNTCPACTVGPNKPCVDLDTGLSMGIKVHVGRIPEA